MSDRALLRVLSFAMAALTAFGCGKSSESPSGSSGGTSGASGVGGDGGGAGSSMGGASGSPAGGTGGTGATGGGAGASTGGASGSSGAGGMPAGPPATLLDFWNGKARWNLYQALPPETAQRIKIVDGVWYGFSRTLPGQTVDNPMCPGTCGTAVRVSTDQGRTWSDPTVIISPVPGSAWACCATDGDVTYDPVADEWSYLLQCTPEGSYETHGGQQVLVPGPWNGCLFKRAGADPVGPFTAAGIDNPVVQKGTLWSQICDDPVQDDCRRIPDQEKLTNPGVHSVDDEGTFQIIEKRAGYYYVHMHGYDGVRGYSGIVRSPDLRTFEVAPPDTPPDAIHDRDDTNQWRENWNGGMSVGGAANTIVREGNYYFMLADGVDLNLACSPGQNWNLGLMRSASLASTTWEQFPQGNPILYSSHRPDFRMQDGSRVPLWCGLQYWGLFQDTDTKRWYMAGARLARYSTSSESHVLVYALEGIEDQIDNGNFWKCNDEGWSAVGSVNHRVVRDPNGSSDFTCFLELECGADGCDGDEIFQDVGAVDLRGRSLRFAGDLRADQDTTATLFVRQLDVNGTVLSTETAAASLGRGYQRVSGVFLVHSSAQTLRFGLLPQGQGLIRADAMSLAAVDATALPQDCAGPYGPIAHGQTRVYYGEDRAVRCRYQNRTCRDGVLSGDGLYRHEECEDLHDGLIESLYRGFLDREPDQAGLDYWRAEHIGSPRGELVTGFVAACDASLASYPVQDYPIYGLDYYVQRLDTCEEQLSMIFDAFYGSAPGQAWMDRCQTDLAALSLTGRAQVVASSGDAFENAWGGAW